MARPKPSQGAPAETCPRDEGIRSNINAKKDAKNKRPEGRKQGENRPTRGASQENRETTTCERAKPRDREQHSTIGWYGCRDQLGPAIDSSQGKNPDGLACREDPGDRSLANCNCAEHEVGGSYFRNDKGRGLTHAKADNRNCHRQEEADYANDKYT
ncbi:MAG: hypothetical protein ACYDGN_12570 [Acidimicrobiales bacterium]